MQLSPTQKILKPLVSYEFCDNDKTIFKIYLATKLRHPHKEKCPCFGQEIV